MPLFSTSETHPAFAREFRMHPGEVARHGVADYEDQIIIPAIVAER
jgi:hypothetical protein